MTKSKDDEKNKAHELGGHELDERWPVPTPVTPNDARERWPQDGLATTKKENRNGRKNTNTR